MPFIELTLSNCPLAKYPTTGPKVENAKKIADLGKELHDRIGTFVGHLSKVGKELKSATEAYNKSVSSLDTRLLVTSRKLSAFGISEGEHKTPDQVSIAPSLPSSIDAED